MCPQCGSDDLAFKLYDFGRCRETGYHDAGERWVCRKCGAAGEVEEILNRDDAIRIAEDAAALTMPAFVAINEVAAELGRAIRNHGPMRGAHEGYAVILEELDELWDEVKRRKPDMAKMRTEAIQVAAMALRFLVDVCGEGGGE